MKAALFKLFFGMNAFNLKLDAFIETTDYALPWDKAIKHFIKNL
jgi:hypothetical protein